MNGDQGGDEVTGQVAELEAQLVALRDEVALATNRDIPLLKGTVRTLSGEDIESVDELLGAAAGFRDQLDQFEERLAKAKDRIEPFGDVGSEPSSKEEKFIVVILLVLNKQTEQNGKIALSPQEIKVYTGVATGYLRLNRRDVRCCLGYRVREAKLVLTSEGT